MKENLTDLDYFRTKDDIIFYVKGYYHPDNLIVAIPVFWPDPKGERIHESGRRYRKDVKEIARHQEIPKSALRISRNDVLEVFKPRQAFERFLSVSEDSIWRKIALAFIKEGVAKEDIGIFGSYLISLAKKEESNEIKDVDFLIYGVENFRKLRKGGFEKIRQKLDLGRISKDHIDWHARKYGQYFKPGLTNFRKTLERKWPSLQIAPGILSTVRFIYKDGEIPPDPIDSAPSEKIVIGGKVLKDEGVHFMPRVFEVKSQKKTFKVVTYFWALYCPVREGDEVEITGMLHESGDLVSVDDYSSGIKIIN